MPFQGVIGIVVLISIAFLLSEKRKAIPWRSVIIALVIQLLLALLLLEVPLFQTGLALVNQGALALQKASEAGSSMVFGYLGGGPLPFAESYPGASFILAFKSLPIVIVISALSALLFYWRVLPTLIQGVSYLLEKTLKVSGVVGVGTAANVFVGMVEAPLCVRPYLKEISRAELFILMTAGMATVAGTVMVLYAVIIGDVMENAMGHILTASLISAPAAIMFAMIMVPDSSFSRKVDVKLTSNAHSSMDAITYGTEEGLKLFLNIIAMLLVLVSLITLLNSILSLFPELAGEPVTLQRILGWVFAPLMWALGMPWAEAQTAGQIMGIKTVLNEFLAYLELSKMEAGLLSPQSKIILIYSLCGFANFGSLGIMVGGLAAMIPQRRQEIISLGGKSMVSGTLATCLTGAIVGLLWRVF